MLMTMTDDRFEFADFGESDIFWLLGLDRQQNIAKATGYIN
jgi:hypothetical protein